MTRWLAAWAVVACGSAALAGDSPKTNAKPKPNVLFLFADDLRADVIGALGNPHVITPNLDKLVRRGTAFTRAHILGGNQGAVCVPSRAMMLSGKTMFTVPSNLGGVATWPMALRAAGYRTFMTGKWHNGAESVAVSFPGAKSVFLGGMSNQFSIALVDVPAEGKAKKTGKKDAKGDLKKGTHSSERFADEAIGFVRQKQTGPWALYVAFTAPHDPREAPKEWHAKFDPKKLPLPPNYLPEHPFDNGEMKIRDEKLEAWPRTPDAVRKHIADYYAILGHLDEQIGRILAALEETGQLENTVIVFAGDNGLALGSHGLFGKQNVYDHSVRVPLLISGPGLPKDRRSDAMCYLFDLCPTLAEIAGAKTPEGIHGKSLVPVLTGAKSAHREALMFAYRDIQRAVTDGKHRAIWYTTGDRVQLFDIVADPHEMRDLSTDPAHAATLARLRERLTALQREFGDEPGKKKSKS